MPKADTDERQVVILEGLAASVIACITAIVLYIVFAFHA